MPRLKMNLAARRRVPVVLAFLCLGSLSPFIAAGDSPAGVWRPSPGRVAADVQAHLSGVAPSDSRALISTLRKRITAPGATPGQVFAGVALMHALSGPDRLASLRAYIESAAGADPEAARLAIDGMEHWASVLRGDAAARQELEEAAGGSVDRETVASNIKALFDGTLALNGGVSAAAGPETFHTSRLKPREPQAKDSARAQEIPSADDAGLPFAPTRAIALSHAAAVTKGRLAAGKDMAESDYRAMAAEALFAGDETLRMDTLLRRQAADPAQALLEVVSNAQDAGFAGVKKVGRFGVGGQQILGELKDPADRVVMETSKGDGRAAQFVFWSRGGEVFFDYRLVESRRRGTVFRLRKKLGGDEARRRKAFLERKLRANDRGPIVWKSGERVNQPEEFLEWGARARPGAARAPPVAVGLDAGGYDVEDRGRGMGLKEVFERYLNPYNTDKPVPATEDPARLLYRRDVASAPEASLGVAMVEIERAPLAAGGRRLNLAGGVFIDLPHDTDLTEDRGAVSLVPADQSVTGAVRGLRLLIDRLTDPSGEDPARFALINSLAALIREKQPAHEKGVTRGDLATATDLLWYLRRRLESAGLLAAYRARGAAFLPNSSRWSPLEGLSDTITFLDDELFSPSARDYAAAGFAALPPALTRQPAWRAFEARSKAAFYARELRRDGALAVVGDGVVVIDKSLAEAPGDAEVLIARIAREMRRAPAAEEPRPQAGLARLRSLVTKRFLAPALVAAGLLAAPAAYHHAPAWLGQRFASEQWTAFDDRDFGDESGHAPPASALDLTQAWNRKPQEPFGSFAAKADVDPFFVFSLRATLLENGAWTRDEAPRAKPAGPSGRDAAGGVDVRYRIELRDGVAERLLNQAGGRIGGIELKGSWGRTLAYRFDPRTDQLSVSGYAGPAMVHYRIESSRDLGEIDAASALPKNELRDFPRQWRAALDPVKNASDEEKLAAVDRLMAKDFVYDYSRGYDRDGLSWGHTAQRYLDAHRPIPIICGTSSLYYYMMARYAGLPAAYARLVNSDHGVFYHDLMGHVKVMVKAGGRWRLVETTGLMPTKVAAPVVIPSGGHAEGSQSFGAWIFKWAPKFPVLSPSVEKIIAALIPWLIGVPAFGLALYLLKELWTAIRIRAALKPLRRAWALFGWRLERLPLRWRGWNSLGKRGTTQYRPMPWGTLYRKANDVKTVFAATEFGGLRPISGLGDMHIGDRTLTFVSQLFFGGSQIDVFDGSQFRTIYRSRWNQARLLPPLGPRRYAVIGKRLVRVDPEAGNCEEALDLGKSGVELLPMESEGGVDRFATLRPAGWGKIALRSLTVSGNRGEWDGPEQIIKSPVRKPKLGRAWRADHGMIYEILPKDGKRGTAALFVEGKGTIPLTGLVEAVADGKVFVADESVTKAYDLASLQPVEAKLGEAAVSNVKEVGDDLFRTEEVQDGRTRYRLRDSRGGLVAETEGASAAAVRAGGVVYYRQENEGAALYAAAPGGPVRKISLAGSAERRYAQACSAATGLPADLFAPLDESWKDLGGELLASWDAKAFRAAVERDKPFVDRLPRELRDAAPYQAAMMPEWSIARLFLSPEAARAPIDPEVLSRLDRLVRENIGRQDWLRTVLEFVDRVLPLGSASAEVGHYLDMIGAAPEILEDLRQAVLKPVPLPDGSRVVPLGYLSDPRDLPPLSQLFLEMLKNGPENLLRREPDGAPKGPPSFALEARGESLSRLIAASRRLSEEQIDGGGLRGFARAFDAVLPGERADLSSVRGVVVNQGLSAPVWIRELIQNARDAVRETRRAGRAVPPEVSLRSFLTEDGSRWMVSVRDGVGMKLSRLLKALLVPEATTKTLADEVRGFLELGGGAEEKTERLLSEFFDDAARRDPDLAAFLRQAVAGDPARAARLIAERWSERMKKGGAGFFGIGFFTVFGGADEVIVRTGAQGFLREAALVPVRDETGRLADIRVRWIRDYDDPAEARRGTEVLRVKNVTAENYGRLLIENAYVHIMAGKYAGGVSDVGVSINGQPIREGLETVGEKGGIRSRIARSARPRWTVDELFVQEPPPEGTSLIPEEMRAALLAAGWNLDFPAATPVVRTRVSVQSPGRYAAAAAALALPAAYRLYRQGALALPGAPSYDEHRKTSPWDAPPPASDTLQDAAAVDAGADTRELWQSYSSDPRRWTQLMLAVCDDKERVLRRILGPELCAALDGLRARGELLRVGPLPAEGAAGYESAVRDLHSAALARARAGEGIALAGEPAAAGLARVLGRLASFIEEPPPFIAAGAGVWEAVRRCLDEGLAVPLMDAVLKAAGRGSDAAAVRLFEGWLKTQGAKKELETLFLGGLSRAQAEESLAKLWKAASRGGNVLIPVRPPPAVFP